MPLYKKLFSFLLVIIVIPCSGQQVPELVVPKGFFMVSAGLNTNGDLVTLSTSDKLKIWNLDSLKLRVSVEYKTKGSYNAHFSPDGKYIVISNSNGTTTIVNPNTGKSLYTVDGWIQDILKKEISADGKYIITIPFTGKMAKVWDLETGKLVSELKGHSDEVGFAIYDNKGDKIVTCDRSGNVALWEAGSSKQGWNINANEGEIFYACFSSDDKYLATASYDGTSTIIETGTGKIISKLKGHTSLITDLQFASDNEKIISASSDKTAAVWKVSDGKRLITIKGHIDEVLTCRFAEDEKTILTSSKDGTMRKWSAATGKLLNSIQFAGDYGTYSIHNNKLILCNSDRINIYTYPGLRLQYSLLQLDSSNYLVFDSLGRYDGTEAARKLLYFKCNKEIIELDQVKDQLWVPDLAQRINKGETINARTIGELNICELTPVTKTISENSSHIQFGITPRRGKLGETVLMVNNIEVRRYPSSEMQKNGTGFILSINKKDLENYFVAGQKNKIMIKSYTADNSFSSRGAVGTSTDTVRSQAAPNLYAVLVGVSDYKGEDMDLKYAAKDANDISLAISNSAKKFLNTDGKDHVFVYNLTTSPNRYQLPEKNSIKNLIKEIGQKSNANDIIIIFFAGHGVMGEQNKQFYFLTADASSLSGGSAVTDVGISTTELAEWLKPQNVKAQKRILILDACNSGQAIKDFVSLGSSSQNFVAARSDDKARQVKAIDKLNEKSGLFILAASASDQSAYEMSRYSQGLLTYALLKAIKEEPDILQEGKYLDVSRWFNAAERTVTDLTKDNAARQQPQIVSTTNFNIGVVDEEVLSKIILPGEKPLFSNSNMQNNDGNIAMDDLGLNKLLDQQLSDVTARGADSPIGFSTANRSDDAYSPNGRYEITGNKIIARLNISQFKQIKHRFEITGTTGNLHELVEKIVEQAIGIFH